MKEPNIIIANNFYKSAKKFLIQVYYTSIQSPKNIWEELIFLESYTKILGGVVAIDHLVSTEDVFVYLIYIELEDRIHIYNPNLFLLPGSKKSVFDTARNKKITLKSLSINYKFESFGKYSNHKWIKPQITKSNRGSSTEVIWKKIS